MQGLAILIGNIIGNSVPGSSGPPPETFFLITEASGDPMITQALSDNIVSEVAP